MAGEWECKYCGTKNTFRQSYCGEGTVNGCGAEKGAPESPNLLERGDFQPVTYSQYFQLNRNLAGVMRGELIYHNDPRLPDLMMHEEFAAVPRI